MQGNKTPANSLSVRQSRITRVRAKANRERKNENGQKSPQEVGASWGQTQPEPCTHKRIHSVAWPRGKGKRKLWELQKRGQCIYER